MKFIEMFSGIGGFRLGLERVGFKCVWANDNNKWANFIYKKNFGNKELIEENVEEINPEEIPEHQLLTAGFPCPTFSIAGQRKGFKEDRGKLFFDIARIVKVKRPTLLLLENVRGLLSVQKGYCFWKILQTLDELGYDVEWQILNSKYFGVPQNRERVFIIGHLRGTSTRQVFPIGKTTKELIESQRKTQEERTWIRTANTLSRRYWKDGSENLIQIGKDPYRQVNRVYSPLGISPTLNANTGGRHIPQILVKTNVRKLTPIECERLQGFPDNWTEGISDTQRYKTLGNAITVNVVEYLGRLLL